MDVVCHLDLFLLAIVLSVLLRFTASDYPFGIFHLSYRVCTSTLYDLYICMSTFVYYNNTFRIVKLESLQITRFFFSPNDTRAVRCTGNRLLFYDYVHFRFCLFPVHDSC